MRFAWTLLAGLALLVTGCSVATVATEPPPNPNPNPGNTVPFSGTVHGGQSPISGAKVYLLAIAQSGTGAAAYGKASTSLLTNTGNSDTIGDYVLTDSTGHFTIAADEFSCSGGQAYLYSQGGNASYGDNEDIGLMAVLGQCSNSSFSGLPAVIQMNEVTTVAAAYALAGYAKDATDMSGPASSAAATGMANAAKNAANLANIGTGFANTTTPGGNGTVPQSKLDTLANILASCINSVTDATGCSTLFLNAENASGAQPADTATAAINIAHNPAANTTELFALSTPSAQFPPALSSAPNDWLIAVSYTGGGLDATCDEDPTVGSCYPSSVGIDSQGNIWIANYYSQTAGAGEVAELSNTGNALSPTPTGFTGDNLNESYGLAVNTDDSVWVVNEQSASSVNGGDGSITVLNSSGVIGTYAGTDVYYPYGAISADTNGDLWIANFNGNATLINSSGVSLSGADGYAADLDAPFGVAIDANHNAWFPNSGASASCPQGATTCSVTSVSPDGTQIHTYETGGGYPYKIATDAIGPGIGHVWITNYISGTVSELELPSTGAPTLVSSGSGYSGGGLYGPDGVAIDGVGNVWITDFHGAALSELEGAAGTSPGTALSPSSGYGADADLSGPDGIAIDSSGNVWVSNQASGSVTQFVGAAAPVKTPVLGPPSLP
jgi:sugar lactone lactonase YvrE